MFNGTGVSPGVAISHAFVLQSNEWDHSEFHYVAEDAATEWRRVMQAIEQSRQQIRDIQRENTFLKATELWIMDAHLSILEDPMMISELKTCIREQRRSALQAVRQVIHQFEQLFESIEDDYMRERVHDLRDVGQRIIKNLLGQTFDVLPVDHQYILVAHEIPPSLTAQLNPHHVQAIVTTLGSQTSHVSIMARALGIPYVVGVDATLEHAVHNGDLLAVDGSYGAVVLNPDGDELRNWQFRETAWQEYMNRLAQLKHVVAISRDGQVMELLANMNTPQDIEYAIDQNASGIGLFRSEYLFMDRPFAPSEEEQYEVYTKIIKAFRNRKVVIRTIDIGGDKSTPALPLPNEDNPFLGLRAIRFSLAYPEFLRTQLRAILRAAKHGPVHLLLPMVTMIEEVREFRRILQEVQAELREQGVAYGAEVRIGAMIEVPAAALIVEHLLDELDFLSIGTNDLVQYTLAADRLNERVANVYDPYHPALIRLLAYIARSAKQREISLSVCGELAGESLAVPLWFALGVKELSMSASRLLPVKETILQVRADACTLLLDSLLQCRTSAEVRQLLTSALTNDERSH